MSRFRDRREEFEDPDEEDVEESPRQKKLFKKDFKDLNPGDKKGRREPKKPWGSKERLLVLITLAVTFGVSAFLYFSATGFEAPEIELPKIPSFKLPNYFGEETIIIKR